MAETSHLKALFVLIGDFDQQRLRNMVPSGVAIPLDSHVSADLPATGPGRTRRIDFGISQSAVAATLVEHKDGPADHVAVKYALDFEVHFEGQGRRYVASSTPHFLSHR